MFSYFFLHDTFQKVMVYQKSLSIHITFAKFGVPGFETYLLMIIIANLYDLLTVSEELRKPFPQGTLPQKRTLCIYVVPYCNALP